MVLLHWVAFSFQRDLTSKAGIFYIPKESPNTKHTDARTGTDTHTQTLATVNTTQLAKANSFIGPRKLFNV